MSTTPSVPIQVIDLPEVTGLVAEGVYNFFVRDETINETGLNGVSAAKARSLEPLDTNRDARNPRYIKLSWVVQDSIKSAMEDQSTGVSCTAREVRAALEAGQVYTEEASAGSGFDNYIFSAENLPDELEMWWRTQLTNTQAHMEEEFAKSAISRFRGDRLRGVSPPELIRAYRFGISRPPISFIMSMFPPYYGLPPEAQTERQNSTFMTPHKYHYMNAPMMLRRNYENGVGRDRIGAISRYLYSKTRTKEDASRFISDGEYIFDTKVLNLKRVTSGEDVPTEVEVTGYLIEKERLLGGETYKMPSVYIHGKKAQVAYDYNVAYGQKYNYSVRTVAKVMTGVTDFKTGYTYIGEYFIASSKGCPSVCTLIETKRPDPPCDIRYYYDYDADNLLITWAPPVNPQRDVKYIQIFRRENISQPFTLLAHYDFNDSVIIPSNPEFIHPGARRSAEVMPTFHVDAEFDKTRSYIYSIVAMDARRLSSYYSTQTMVSFDTTTNKLHKELVSYQGAPKQYPNWYLKENFFPDSIKDSHHASMKVYFDPEAYTFERSSGEKSQVFFSNAEDPKAKYILQIINVDRLAEQQVEIKITKNGAALEREIGIDNNSVKSTYSGRVVPTEPTK